MLLPLALLLASAGPNPASGPNLTLPITRDTFLSRHSGEQDTGNGGAPRIKIKSNEEMTLLDFDPTPLKGKVVKRATLHFKTASPKEPFRRVTVSTIAVEWFEGTARSYQAEKGASTFRHRRYPDEPWTPAGGDLSAVILGQGGTMWRMAEATPPDADGWQTVAVEPAIVMARTAGVSHGLLVFDDTGSEWTRDGEKFTVKHFPNRFAYSHDQNKASAPYLTVELGGNDTTPPEPPANLIVPQPYASMRPPLGQTIDLFWMTPPDQGAGVVGFTVEIDGKPVPRYLIPAPNEVGRPVRMRLLPEDFPVRPQFTAVVRAVDGAGNISKPLEIRSNFPGWKEQVEWKVELPKPPSEAGPVLELAGAEMSILDPLDKVHPVTGVMIPPRPESYKRANHLWSGGTIRLHSARNEFVGFQLLVRGPIEGLSARLEFDPGIKDATASFSRYAYVGTKLGPLPDPLVPLDAPFTVPTPGQNIDGQKFGSLLAEVYVGHGASPGVHKARLRLQAGGKTLAVPVELSVWPFALPDRLSFIPEMNSYGLPADEIEYYRLAHRHRTALDRVPYSQSGAVAEGCAPKWDGQSFDWAKWDERFGPLFDGRAFADLPRKGVSLDVFYLPLHENWPTPMAGNYNGSYWADEAFPPKYRDTFVKSSEAFARHFSEKGWDRTLFLAFFNGKVDFKAKGWSRGSSPWLLDEPANWQDYWALKWFGDAFHEGVRRAGPGKARLLFRADISRPEWQRDALDAVLDYNVVAGDAFARHHRLVAERRDRLGQVLIPYGGSNAIEQANTQPVGWCLDAWTQGADGVTPWTTVGSDKSWTTGDHALFYPGRKAGLKGPAPSIRLKAYLRGQQDVEYLALLQESNGWGRRSLGETVRRMMKLKPVWQPSGSGAIEDAGVARYTLMPEDYWALRMAVATELVKRPAKAPTPLTAVPIPQRDPSIASPGHVSTEAKQ